MCIKWEELLENDIDKIRGTDEIGGIMYECKICKKIQIEAAEIYNNIKKDLEIKMLLLKNAERNEFNIAENIVEI